MAETLRTIASSTAKLRELLAESKRDLHRIRLLIDALDDGLKRLWPSDIASAPAAAEDSAKSDPDQGAVVNELVADASLWKETLSIVATGRVVGVAAEADDALALAAMGDVQQRLWVGDGKRYARWLGTGVSWLVRSVGAGGDNAEGDDSAELRERSAAQLLAKGMGMGYLDNIVEETTKSMLLRPPSATSEYYRLVGRLIPLERRRFFSALLRYLAKILSQDTLYTLQSPEASPNPREGKTTSAVAGLLNSIVTIIPGLLPSLIDFLTSQPQNIALVRPAVVALPPSSLPEVLRKTWSQFSDKLHIQHTSILSQEANVRVLLLAAGYVHRTDPRLLKEYARSSMHNNGVSERLKSSGERIRWLGMCVGMAVSDLVDEDGKKMDFDMEDMKSEEAQALRALVNVKDEVGKVEDLPELFAAPNCKGKKVPKSIVPATKKSAPKRPRHSQEVSSKPKIIEIVDDLDGDLEKDDEEDEEDDLVPYAKPDSDDPDSEEDASLVNRDKPKAPSYIRDLIAQLSDTSNESNHNLALRTAAPLIRRKATFGSELHDRTLELAQCLVSLQDQFETEGWHELRQAALIALVIAEPKIMGPWLARMLFEGDLSISQRIAVVTGIGLGGRELAGFMTDDDGQVAKVAAEEAGRALQQDETWPTKKLTGKMHEIYSGGNGEAAGAALARRDRQMKLESRRVEALSRKMEQVMLRPVSTKEISRPRPRTRMLKNDLASVVADFFFFPLTRYWQVYSQASAGSSNPLSSPILTSLTLKTLSILLTAAGPAALSLPQLTKELFNLLLSVRSAAVRHSPVLEAVLFALLALLNIHSHETATAEAAGLRWLAEECGGPLVEFREWVGLVWERLEGESGGMKLQLEVRAGSGSVGDAGDEETQRCKVLAASVMVKVGEVVEKYQRLLAGELTRV